MRRVRCRPMLLLVYAVVIASLTGVFTILINIMDNRLRLWHSSFMTLSKVESYEYVEKKQFEKLTKHVDTIEMALRNLIRRMNKSDGKKSEKRCSIPRPSTLYPFCEAKVTYVRSFWKQPCFEVKNDIKNGDDLCKIIIYLSEVEKWCPRLPWRKQFPESSENIDVDRKITIRTNIDDLFTTSFSDPNYIWMKNRISSMKQEWETAIKNVNKKRPLNERTKKKIIVFLGAFSYQPWLLKQAFSGGPLGELVQWSDIITSLYLLGHDVTVITNSDDMKKLIPRKDEDGCINNIVVQEPDFDLLYTDIGGVQTMSSFVGPYWSHIRCKIRVIDSFGTEAPFNFGKFIGTNTAYKSAWGGLDLNLRQFMTMFPHSPDNSFAGFVSGAYEKYSENSKTYLKKKMALVYGKQDGYWNIGNQKYLDIIHDYVDVHGTFNLTQGVWPTYIPKYIINHGVVDRHSVEKLLQQSKVFVGLGFPFEGPAPLEAIANGAAFLNPKYSQPLNRYNSGFFAMKPTRRLVTSQNPYAEQFIGEPYVYTIDINNATQVTRALEKIMKTALKPYLPYEYTHEGMLERMSAQVEHLEFCEESQWPPLKNMRIMKGKPGQSCAQTCWEKGQLCEPSYWKIINRDVTFKRRRLLCESVKYSELLVAPSYEEKTKICHLQQQPLLYSCVSFSQHHTRLCPCRDFIKGQVALCEGCW